MFATNGLTKTSQRTTQDAVLNSSLQILILLRRENLHISNGILSTIK